MNKTEVYSWRITPHIKRTLEHEARREGTSVSVLLERITTEWILSRRDQANDEAEQGRLHAAVDRTLGTIQGRHPKRAESVKSAVRKRISVRYGR
jgi:hypothetical protein